MRVVAVVVTFNRLPLLRRLVARLREVPEVDEVLVVDNASSDGTGEWLAATGVVHRTLPENRGGAGGFHDGLGWAMERGADLAWLMDDDGIPDLDSLAILLERENLDFWGPAVLAEQDPGRLCFPIRLPGGTRVVHRMAEVEAAAVDGLIAGVVIPFNGVLVTRDLVDRIGLPREEFFIWGDDVEYLWRAERAGARVATVVGAHFRHPATDDLGTPMMFGRTTYNHSASDLKHYCMARNNLLNLRDYRGWPHALAFVVKTVWFYLFTKPQPGRVVLSARAMYAGLRGDFTRPPRVPRRGWLRCERSEPRDPRPSRSRWSPTTAPTCWSGCSRASRRSTGPPTPSSWSTTPPPTTPPRCWRPARCRACRCSAPRRTSAARAASTSRVRTAYSQGFDRIWLMDDDVVPAPECLTVLMAADEPCLMAVREDTSGALVEKAAVVFDLANPLAIKPKTAMVETTYGTRAAMPERVELQNVAFEGFMVRRDVVAAIGFPDATYFIFYDDVDYALRARRAGFRIWALRDAVLVRQLSFDQQHDLAGWKGYYMYRNLFVVHLRYGENALVRLKPWLVTLLVVLLSPLRGGRAEARNVTRAMRDARGMRSLPSASVE